MEDGILWEPVKQGGTLILGVGVTVDTYQAVHSGNHLGVIFVEPGQCVPLQQLLTVDRTLEEYISGTGKLIVYRNIGGGEFEEEVHHVDQYVRRPYKVEVRGGDRMQWVADEDDSLFACTEWFPNYKGDGIEDNFRES